MKNYAITKLVWLSDWLSFDSPWQLYRLAPYVDRLLDRIDN